MGEMHSRGVLDDVKTTIIEISTGFAAPFPLTLRRAAEAIRDLGCRRSLYTLQKLDQSGLSKK